MNKKQRKYQHTVEKQTQVKCTIYPTKHIAICNSGLVNGLSEETIYEHFSKFGNLEKIIMLPGKSCCFVKFKDISSASDAFNAINGKLNIAQYDKPLYLSFTEDLSDNLIEGLEKNSSLPNGLIVLESFISEDEETILLGLNNFDEMGNSLKHRQVRHYGYEFKYSINNVDINSPLEEKIPQECEFLWERLETKLPSLKSSKPDQLTVNCYKPGHGIPSHVDTHSAFEDPIFILSLGSAIVMDFKNGDLHYPLLIPQRSFVVMSSESRYGWTHGITPRKMDILQTKAGLTVLHRDTRTSFTFRKVREGECNCDYHSKCDSYLLLKSKNEISTQIAERLEAAHVHDIYENIAQHFNETRHKPWPDVLGFIKTFETGSILADIGCGNGKYMHCREDSFQIGMDTSISLLNVCRDRGYQVFLGNCLRVPLKDEVADGAISIAVIHHLSTEQRRMQAVQEILRILKIGGKALICVWAKEQNLNDKKSSYLKQDRKNRRKDENAVVPNEKISVLTDIELPVHVNRTQFQHHDLLVPWKLKNNSSEEKTFLRYYHVFKEGELENLCRKQNNVKILRSYYDQGNWGVILEKISENAEEL